MNIAENVKSYYTHIDFEDMYLFSMCEDSSAIEEYISEAVKNWDFEDITKGQFNGLDITNNGAEYLAGYIFDNANDLYTTFNSYYVGSLCVASCSFGEQCEQLDGLHNSRTGKNYTLPYLRKCFEDAGYCINKSDKNCAYYDLSGSGVMISLDSIPADIIAIAMHTV